MSDECVVFFFLGGRVFDPVIGDESPQDGSWSAAHRHR
jgi:hypothetical protein